MSTINALFKNWYLWPFNLLFPLCQMWWWHVWNFMAFSITLENDGYRCGISRLQRTLCTPFVPTWFSYLLDFFVPKRLSGLFARQEIWGSKSNIFAPNFHHQEVFWHPNFGGHFRVVVVLYFKNHTYNYLANGQRTLISPKLKTWTIVLEQREY